MRKFFDFLASEPYDLRGEATEGALLLHVEFHFVWGSAKNICKQEDFPLKLRERTSLDAERVIPMPRKQVSFRQMKLTEGLDLHLKTARRKRNLPF